MFNFAAMSKDVKQNISTEFDKFENLINRHMSKTFWSIKERSVKVVLLYKTNEEDKRMLRKDRDIYIQM